MGDGDATLDHSVLSLHAWATSQLGADGTQIWVIDDLGFHPRASAGRAVDDADRALVRRSCIEHAALVEAGRLVVPLALSDRRSGACLFAFPFAAKSEWIDLCQSRLSNDLPNLDEHLQLQRLSRLSGSARESDQLRSILTLAHTLENCPSKRQVLGQIHQLLKQLIYAENFFVVVLDSSRQLLEFEFFVDQYDSDETPIPFVEGGLHGSLAAHVVAANRVVRGSSRELLAETGHGDMLDDAHYGPRAFDWLGVPMNVAGEVLGAVVIQSYDREIRFHDRAPSVLSMVAEAIGAALHRRRIREELESTVHERTAQLESAKADAERALADLQAAQQHLLQAEKMASLGQLVAGVAHEVNTPLGVALTANSHLASRAEDFRQQAADGALSRSALNDFVDTVAKSAGIVGKNLDRAAKLVQNFKQVSVDRSSDGRREFALDAFIEALTASMAGLWRGSSVQLRLDCPCDLRMDSFPGALGQVLSSLIENALQHAFTEGEPGLIQLNCASAADDQATIVVSDNGHGIAADDLGKIFEPFYTTGRHRGGTGLGLHIAYNLVTQKLGGSIEVDSEPGRGTRFTVQLPLSAPR